MSAAGALCALAMSTLSCSKPQKIENPPPAVQVSTVSFHGAAASSEGAHYSGTLVANSHVDLAFRVGGYVDSLREERGSDGRLRPLEPGDKVRHGVELARVRPTDYQARVEQSAAAIAEAKAAQAAAAAQMAQTQAQLSQASADWARAQKLYAEQALIRPDYDAAKARYDLSVAQVDNATAMVDAQAAKIQQAVATRQEAGVSFADTRLSSPLNGIVLARAVEKGSLVAPGTLGFTLADISLVKVNFGVPDTSLRNLHQGARLPLAIDAFPGRTFEGVVTSIAPAADERTRTFNVELTLSNPGLLLKPGMIAGVSVAPRASEETASGIRVPFAALVRAGTNDKEFAVYILENSNGKQTVRLRPVQLGPVTGNAVEVKAGLTSGERIITAGGGQLTDGESVTVLE